jgi:endonuclease/exonuclease/phosphatase family metal-dependent hydrolase
MKIATWNVERPKLNGWTRNPRIIAKLHEVNADLWILTETNTAISPGDNFFSAATLPELNYHKLGESYATIWTRWPMLRNIKTYSSEMAVCIEVESPIGPMIVYGSIITYANDKGSQGKSGHRVEHKKAIIEHGKDWKRIRAAFPNHHFVAAGDYNQSRDGSGWYEDATSVELLSGALRDNGLRCVTDNIKLVESRSTIDHICVSKSFDTLPEAVTGWEGLNSKGERLSDHNGVVMTIVI